MDHDPNLEDAANDLASNTDPMFVVAYSTAISTKRIADILEQALNGKGLEVVLDTLANYPMNTYGEGFSDAIQNAIERGQRGINSQSNR